MYQGTIDWVKAKVDWREYRQALRDVPEQAGSVCGAMTCAARGMTAAAELLADAMLLLAEHKEMAGELLARYERLVADNDVQIGGDTNAYTARNF